MILREALSPEIATLAPIIGLAFSAAIRKMIGYRDGWECQWEDGCNLGRDGNPAKYQDGFMVDAAHVDHDPSLPTYDVPDNGRILCLTHHYLDHLAQGDFNVLPLLASRDPYIYDVRKHKKKYPWLNGYRTVADVLNDID